MANFIIIIIILSIFDWCAVAWNLTVSVNFVYLVGVYVLRIRGFRVVEVMYFPFISFHFSILDFDFDLYVCYFF